MTNYQASTMDIQSQIAVFRRLSNHIANQTGYKAQVSAAGVRIEGYVLRMTPDYFNTPFGLPQQVREAVKEFNEMLGEF